MQETSPREEIIEIDDDSDDPSLPSGDEAFFSLNEVDAAFNDEDTADPTLPQHEQSRRTPQGGVPEFRNFYQTCLHAVIEVFPDICHDHVQQLYDERLQDPGNLQPAVLMHTPHDISQGIIMKILDGGGKYPKEKDRIRELKRKRSMKLNSDDEEAARWRDAARDEARLAVTWRYSEEARRVLQEEFASVPNRFIELKFRETGHFYATYVALERAEHTYEDGRAPYTRLKKPRRVRPDGWDRLHALGLYGQGNEELKREIDAARKYRQKEQGRRKREKDLADAEAADEKRYRDNGDVMECQCCFGDYPINKLTHCDGDEPHFFCFECALRNVMEEIGQSRFKLQCMDGSGCKASFNYEQKQRFLDEKTFEAFERGQQQAQIRLANLEGLSKCPFCDFAAICPPVDIDREFRCSNPECEKISCRLCKTESHTPLSCEEAKKENGVSERHFVEEARTEALLRTCPKCNVKIMKEDGCNKVICPCGGWLCDYCGKDITKDGYNHFEGGVNGGRTAIPGRKCPTYDDLSIRRKTDLDKAEAEALKKVRAENPHLTEDDLKIKFAEVTNTPSGPANPLARPQHVVHHAPNRGAQDQIAAQRAALLQQRQRNIQNQAAIMQQMAVHQNHAQNFARRLNAMYVPGLENGPLPDDAFLRQVNQGLVFGMGREGQALAGLDPQGRRRPEALPTYQDYLAGLQPQRPDANAPPANPLPLPGQPQGAERRHRFDFG